MSSGSVKTIEKYESGKYQGCEIDLVIHIHHNESDGDDKGSDWRHDHTIKVSGADAWAVLDLIKSRESSRAA